MSFRCEKCDVVQETYSTPVVVVTKIRPYVPAPGFEIEKEVRVCAPCSEPLLEAGPEQMESIRNVAFFESEEQATVGRHSSPW